MAEKYEEQLARAKRYLERFSKINDGIPHTQESPNYDDDIYAFFQNCYHLKDWIKNDPSCKKWTDVESFINLNEELKLCADICNGLKHLKLTSPRSTENPEFSSRRISLNLGGTPVIAIKYELTTNSGNIDAFELAKKCIPIWESYIANNTTHPSRGTR